MKGVVDLARSALRMASVSLPHLSGLAHLVRLAVEPRIRTAGIFPSGRLVLNPEWFGRLSLDEATFVVAHELLHLALRSHERSGDMDRGLFNYAHDLIINDMLREALKQSVPAGGLHEPGARHQSAEAITDRLRRERGEGWTWWSQSWEGGPTPSSGPAVTALGAALRQAGLGVEPEAGGSEPEAPELDVLPEALERAWFPGLDRADEARLRGKIRREALRSVSLEVLQRSMERAAGPGDSDAGGASAAVEALHSAARPPWELGLQRWMEEAAPGPRTYARPSRRGADRSDLVLVGRRREGWTLHVVLDTSGSMTQELARALGAVAVFCESLDVQRIRMLQCDAEVTKDEVVTPQELARYEVAGFGGSDLGPALRRLAEDPEVEAAVVLTDGWIDYPAQPMPYAVLWALTQHNPEFRPSYGSVLEMAP
jgi:predicted metal-dependent peptidase